ncbi:MAG TPA: DUF5994 family protein [Aeromicrobium sp.]|nr:DUF5994 family protein [Aeromicrobium sp.]
MRRANTMAKPLDSTRLAIRGGAENQRPYGAWWPQDRTLSTQLRCLFDLWPSSQGSIARILFSPPDWDDHPHSVQVTGRRVKTGSFPRDDTHEVTLVMHDGQRRFITVIPPATSRRKAARLLDNVADNTLKRRSRRFRSDGQSMWENDGGHA